MSNRKPGSFAPDSTTLDRFARVVGEAHVLREPEAMAPYLVEWRDRYFGRAAAVLRPGTADEVARILAIAGETLTAIVPQGGNTGLVGGQVPFESGNEVVVSLGRLNRIRELDATNNTVTVEAGCVLADVQAAADAAGRLFPLSLGSEGSCQIGGNLSTNAGGTAMLAYGNARDLVLGLEVALADGRLWNGLRRLRKDNTGYDLKHLFIGAEGTLGIITAAVLELFPKPTDKATAMAGVVDPQAGLDLLVLANAMSGRRATALELMPRLGIEFVTRHLAGSRDPLASPHGWYVLIELSGSGRPGELAQTLEAILGEAFERGIVADAVIAASEAQAQAFWRMRTGLSEVQKHEGGSIKHDVSVPVSAVPEFIRRATDAAQEVVPGCRPVPFGHLGDGNIHFNVSQPPGADRDGFLARWDDMSRAVHDVVLDLGGSISAEHGIGRMKRDLMPGIKSDVELSLMRDLKRMFDPRGILNPGKLLPPEPVR